MFIMVFINLLIVDGILLLEASVIIVLEIVYLVLWTMDHDST
jgi:hypothetical protein